ncbi:VCBS repeat-containing protein, partial [Pseudoalteromonas sp. APC 4026]
PTSVQPIAPFEMTKKWEWSSSDFMPEYDQIMSTPMVGQLNDDNGDGVIDNKDVADLLVVTFKDDDYLSLGLLRALSGVDGQELWIDNTQPVFADSLNSLALADVNSDGKIEIAVNDYMQGKLRILSNEGVEIKNFEVATKTFGNLVISDIDNDGIPEIIVGGDVFNFESGYLYSAKFSQAAITFDYDNNGTQEVLSGGALSDIYGNELWKYQGRTGSWFS